MTVALPRPKRKPAHKFTGEVAARYRSDFAEVAADMEMGYYVDQGGHQWDARPFLVNQCLRHLGFTESDVEASHRPMWWPGQEAMRRVVALKVMLRQAQSRAGAGAHPWLDPLLAASVEELLRRLYIDPLGVNIRELVELTTKLARLQNEQRARGELGAPGQHADAVAYQRVTETILQLPPEEQERARRALALVSARRSA